MEHFYLEIRGVHIGAVIVSGAMFALRALAHNLLAVQWPMALPLRILSWTVDTVLLTAALMLMTIIHQFAFVDGWLTMKVLLLVVYIVLGWLAFRADSKERRLLSTAAALAVFGFIVTVARAHNPLGLFASI